MVRHDSPARPFEASGVVSAEAEARANAETITNEVDENAEETETLIASGQRTPGPHVGAREKAPPSLVGMAAVGAGAAILVVGAVLFFTRPGHVTTDPLPPAAPSALVTNEAEPAIVIGGGQRAASTTLSATPAPVDPQVSARPATSAPRRVWTPPPPARRDDCDNPFTVDARGIRHPKPECFKR
jgi:serine/threonine-protein kinase